MHRDRQALNRILAEDYTIVSPRGRVIPKGVYVASRSGEGGPVETSAKFDDVQVRIYGSTAVVTSRFTAELSSTTTTPGDALDLAGPCKGSRIGGNTRTDTWVKRDGSWRLAATQLTTLGFPGAHAPSELAPLCGLNNDELTWTRSTAFPGAQVAPLAGAPYSGPYAIRMKRPDGHVESPHRHESDEYVSVISGVLHVGIGDRVDRPSARTFRAGSFVVIPAQTLHYSWAEGDVLEDVYWSGPAAAIYARKKIALSRDILAQYVGMYKLPSGTNFIITLDGDQLTGQLSAQGNKMPLLAESETKFFLEPINAQLEFVKDTSGKVTHAILRGQNGRDQKATRVP
jgi:mannose-6-phosphate isomerase-like protein (cupin superfamily)